MRQLMHHLIRFWAGFCLVAGLAMGGATTVRADTATATATLTGGSLSETSGTFPAQSLTLNGTNQTMSVTTWTITATDSTGTGNGWNLTITATQFTTGGTTPHTLPTTASTITGVTAVCAAGTCTNPTNSITYPFTIPAGPTPPTAVKFFNAAVNTGMGQFTITPTVSIAVPANAYAGTFSSTLTLAIVSGP
jgi:hypothetical protein